MKSGGERADKHHHIQWEISNSSRLSLFSYQVHHAASHRQHLIEQAREAYTKKKLEEAAGVEKKGTGCEYGPGFGFTGFGEEMQRVRWCKIVWTLGCDWSCQAS